MIQLLDHQNDKISQVVFLKNILKLSDLCAYSFFNCLDTKSDTCEAHLVEPFTHIPNL